MIHQINEKIKFCNSYSRLPTLLEQYPTKPRHQIDWFTVLGENWSCCDNISQHRSQLTRILSKATSEQRAAMMTVEEREILNSLPDQLEVYRGCYEINLKGLSWSLSKDIAAAFPGLNRYYRPDDVPMLATGISEKSDCILKLDRDEAEIVCDRVWLQKVEKLEVVR